MAHLQAVGEHESSSEDEEDELLPNKSSSETDSKDAKVTSACRFSLCKHGHIVLFTYSCTVT